jgi:ATP-dependent DNA helicase DinG
MGRQPASKEGSTPADAAERRLAEVTAGLAGSEARPQQVAMTRAVAEAVSSGRPLAVEAGTGVGKSLAYLCGALPALRAEGARMVVATATKALQDQLAGKDLPAVAAVEPGLTWAVLKGRSNYLCRQAAAEAAGAPSLPMLASDREEVGRLMAWAADSATGDRAELDFEPHPATWAMVSVGADQCPGATECPSGGTCFAEAAYARAREADVVVVNLHLLGAHVASGGFILPEHDVLVVDEAHEAEEVFTASLGTSLSPGRVRAVAGLARTASGQRPGAGELARHPDSLERTLAPLLDRRLPGGATAEAALGEALAGLAEAARRDRAAVRAVDGEAGNGPARDRAAKALDALAADVASVLAAMGDDTVTWVETSGSQPVLRVAPLDVAGPLAEVLWPSATPILTSATLPRGVAGRLGLGPDAVELDVGSPFDYRGNAVLYVPRLPGNKASDHEAAAHAELEALIGAAGGRTLALFTSWRAMRAARAAVDGRLPYRILGQDDLPKPALVEAFRTEETSCLFATMGFWQGVDVPGATCSLVVVDRLPFARPDDPIAQARRERAGAGAFAAVDLPHAAVRLAQGAGRLIRSATDRGVVAVLDPRLAEASYRHHLLAALPPMRRTRDRAAVTAFLAGEPLPDPPPRPEAPGAPARVAELRELLRSRPEG